MQGGFEKNIQQQMQDFNLEPSPLVWQEIDAALDGKKRRRFAVWWLLPGVAALLVAFFGIIYFSTKEETAQKEGNQQPAANSTTKKQQQENTQHNPSGENKNQSATRANSAEPVSKDKQNTHPDINTKPKTASLYKNHLGNKGDQIAKNEEQPKFATSTPPAHSNNRVVFSSADTPKKEPMDHNAVHIDLVATDSSYLENAKKTTTNLNNHVAELKIKTPRRSKQQWGIVLGGGPMSVKESDLGLFGSSSSSLQYDSPGSIGNGSNNGGVSQSRPDSASYITVANSGYHVLAGIQYARKLAGGVEIAGGLQYRFLSNRQKAGSYMYSSQYYSLTGGALLYNAGTITTVTNTAHWLEVPAFMIFTVNPGNKTKFSIQAGGSYAWMFASNWILPDTKLNKLYYNDSLLNKHIFNVNIGTAIELPSDISFGLRYQRSITKLTDQANVPKLIWQNWSFYSTLPLQLKKRH